SVRGKGAGGSPRRPQGREAGGGGHRAALLQHRHLLHHGGRERALRRRPPGDARREGGDGRGHPAVTRLLTPFAPHIADALAEAYGAETSPLALGWPTYDPALVVDEVLPYAVQVNGKLRGEIRIAADAGESEVRAAAENEEKVRAALAGKALR